MNGGRRQFLFMLAATPLAARADIFKRFRKPPRPIRTIWVFATDYTGEMNARLAVAEAFEGAEVIVKEATSLFASDHAAPPDLVVHSMTVPSEMRALLNLKVRSRNRTMICNLDEPTPEFAKGFDLIADRQTFPGVPSRVTPDRLANARAEWKATLGVFPGPRVALFIGGQTKDKVFTQEDAQILAAKVNAAMKSIPGSSLFITNSRRTPAKSMQAFLNELSGFPMYVHDVNQESEPERNPYMAYLAMANYIIATGDSLSMVSDAVATQKPVHVFALGAMMEDRHRRLVVELADSGRIKILGQEPLAHYSYAPLDTAGKIRDALIEKQAQNCEFKLFPF